MKKPRFSAQVTITFSLSPEVASYPPGTSPEAAAHIDTLNLSGDTEYLLDILARTPYSVIVVPALVS